MSKIREPLSFEEEVAAANARLDARKGVTGSETFTERHGPGEWWRGDGHKPQFPGLSNGKGAGTHKVKDCHKPPAREIGARAIYCSASVDVATVVAAVGPRLILDCRNLETQLVVRPVAAVLDGPRSLRRIVSRACVPAPSVVRVAWQDYGVPPVEPSFFVDLARWLQGRPVVCVCMGGHGRSGTAAAALLAAYGMPAAVARVRADHCRSAVETPKQEAFVNAVAALRRKGK